MNRCLCVLRLCPCVLRQRQHVKAANEQRGECRDCDGESDPNSDRPQAPRESQSVGAGKPDQPKAHRGKQHRYAGIVEPAQCTRGNRLHSIGHEEARADEEKRSGKPRRRGVGAAIIAEEKHRDRGMNATTMTVSATMRAAPNAIAPNPALRVATGSRRPTACPTRTVAASEMPIGTMNRMVATCSAI